MNWKRMTMGLLIVALAVGLAMPAAAAKKKGNKKGKQDHVAQNDPYAGRWGLSFGGGGVSSPAGFGFEGRVGVTYYINHWVNVTLAPGFGTYPVEYDGPDQTETTYIKYVPADLSVIFTPVRMKNYGIYMGPGVGVTYYWWTQKEEDPNDAQSTVDVDYDETLYSAFATAGVSFGLGGPFVANVGVTYTIPDVSEFSTENGIFTFGFGGGVVF